MKANTYSFFAFRGAVAARLDLGQIPRGDQPAAGAIRAFIRELTSSFW